MGEIAEMMLAGLMCEGCGEFFRDMDEPGYPRRCDGCRREARRDRRAHQPTAEAATPTPMRSDLTPEEREKRREKRRRYRQRKRARIATAHNEEPKP